MNNQESNDNAARPDTRHSSPTPCSAISADQVAEALQHVWDCHFADTGLAPECITIHGSSTVSANFQRGNFAHWVACYLTQNAKLTRGADQNQSKGKQA
jgi:hypothetical protein